MTTLGALALDKLLPATFTSPGLSEAEFLKLCDQFPDATVEYTSDGTVIVMPPTDPESGARANQVVKQLTVWADQAGHGIVTGPDTGFLFPSGSRRSPDAAWYSRRRWEEAKQAIQPRRRFPTFAPDFVIEVRSPNDRLRELRDKMEDYISDGVELGWLVDPLDRTVEIHRRGKAPEYLQNPERIAGEGPVEGFILDLRKVFGAP